MQSAILFCQFCPSVRQSYLSECTYAYCHTFPPSGKKIILFVRIKFFCAHKFQGEPLSGVDKSLRVGKFCDLRPKLPFIPKTVKISPWLLWITYKTSVDRSVTVRMTLDDLERRDERGQIFPADFRNHANAV